MVKCPIALIASAILPKNCPFPPVQAWRANLEAVCFCFVFFEKFISEFINNSVMFINRFIPDSGGMKNEWLHWFMVSPFAENTHKHTHTHTKTHACWHAGTDHTSGAIRQPNSVEKRAFSAERTRVRELNWIFNGPKPIESACQRKNTLPPCWPAGDRMLGPVMESNLHFELFFHPSWLVRQPSRGEFFRSFVKHATISHRKKKPLLVRLMLIVNWSILDPREKPGMFCQHG